MRSALLAITLLAAIACGSATAPPGPTLTVYQLKFRVIDQVGPPAYCDPDFYPLPRAGGEEAKAISMYQQIRDNADLYAAILEHEHLPAGELTDGQKLFVYRASKIQSALALKPAPEGYAFSYTTVVTSNYTNVAGTVRNDGVVTVTSRAPGGRPNCPICLAASTLIAIPAGSVLVTNIEPGMVVWTLSPDGRRVAEPVLEVGSIAVPAGHLMVHLKLADGRELWVSPRHPTADGRPLGSLATGDSLDGSRIVVWELVPYSGDRTYDLLPAGSTGTYWANGVLLASTLRES